MPNRTKQRRSGGLTLLLYQRTLHPELFKIFASEKVNRRAYEADIWLVEGGHVITFTAGKPRISCTTNGPSTSAFTGTDARCAGGKPSHAASTAAARHRSGSLG